MVDVYRETEWPHGLMCADCPHVFREGERYAKHLYAFAERVPVLRVLCEQCATASHNGSELSAPPA
jgi:hypothetical protein